MTNKSKGYAAQTAKAPLTPHTFERRDPRPTDVVIAIKFCGICHSDIHQARDEWGNAIFPMVPGHEITGIVSKVGSEVKAFAIGARVGVGCIVDSCRECAPCKNGLEQYCTEGMVGTYNDRERDGSLTYGGYSDSIVVDEKYVLAIPDALPLDAAAPLLCAGITLYSPLQRWQVGPGKKVAIIGLGGLGHMGVKLAHAMGAEVTVLSQSLSKMEDGKRLGADHFFATSDPTTFTRLKGSLDLIINTVSGEMDWNQYLSLLRLDGAMVVVGVPEKPNQVKATVLINNRRSLSGSLIGGIAETQEMLDFCAEHHLACDIEVIAMSRVNEAYERVLASDVRYRFVLDLATL